MDDPTSRPLASRSEFQQAVRDALALAAAQGCREMWFCDADHVDWPLSDKAVIDSLTAWCLAHRKLTMLASSFDEVPRRHARWVQWRRSYAHVVECRQVAEEDASSVQRLLLAPGVVTLRVFDSEHHRGLLSRDPAEALRCRDSIDALLQRSSDSFPATTLGL